MSLLQTISKLVLIKSFVLGLLILGLWVRSYIVADTFTVNTGAKSASLASARGILIYRAAADGTDSFSLREMRRDWLQNDPERVLESFMPGQDEVRLGFSSTRYTRATGGLSVTMTVPFWFIFPLIAGRAIFWLTRRGAEWYLRVPRSTGWCAVCQFDAPSINNHCARCGAPVFDRSF